MSTPTGIALRPAAAADREFAWQVRRLAMGPWLQRVFGWDEEAERAAFDRGFDPARILVVEERGRAAGVLEVEDRGNELVLVQMGLLPAFQRRGIGTALVQHLIREADVRPAAILVELLQGNPARRLFERAGFRIVGATPTHVQLRRDAARAGPLIVPLCERPELVPAVAAWHFVEWGHWRPGTRLQDWVAALRQRLNLDRIPATWVLVDNDAPLGSASLVERDLDERPELGPWLTAVYVVPAVRRRGLGTGLVQRVTAEAARLGVTHLYAWTVGAERFGERLGWRAVETILRPRKPTTVMVKQLVAMSDLSLERSAGS
ncbi:MAG: GNAT family N-acetyltransferase [Gemmatimonadota bacterium]